MEPREPRILHGGEAHVIAAGVSFAGRALNLSVGGALISGGPRLETGSRITLSIDLGDGGPPIGAHAKVAWQGEPGMGVHFLRMDDEATHRLTHLVSRFVPS